MFGGKAVKKLVTKAAKPAEQKPVEHKPAEHKPAKKNALFKAGMSSRANNCMLCSQLFLSSQS